jgi:hypothetical protein
MVNILNVLYIRALIYSLGLQIVALLLCTLQMGNLAGFREVLSLVGMLILTPKLLTEIITGDIGISTNAVETLSWVVQFGVWFAAFYVVLFWHSQWNKKNE